MKNILTVLFLALINQLNAQIGFSKTHELNAPGATFHNVIIHNDTLIAVGTARSDSLSPWGLLFAKLDTLGNLISTKNYFDPAGDHYVFLENYDIIKTSDGGYLTVGNFFSSYKGFVVKLDGEGNLDFLKEYSFPKNVSFRKAIEVSGGYLIGGIRNFDNNTYKTFVMKIDFEGNLKWEEIYGNPSDDAGLTSLSLIDNNNILLGIGHNKAGISSGPYSYNTDWTQGSIIGIDSLGEVKYEWLSDLNTDMGPLGIQKTSDGGYIYFTAGFIIHNQWTWGRDLKIIKRDSNFNLVWEMNNVSPKATLANLALTIQPTPDGNYIAAGNWAKAFYPNDTSFVYVGGCLYNFSPVGDSIWLRCDTVPDGPYENYWPEFGYTLGKYGGAAVSASGSIYAVGKTVLYDTIMAPRSLGWLVKIDKHGCLDTLCNLNTALSNIPIPNAVKLFPNPASDFLNIQISTTTLKNARGRIINLSGKVIKEVHLESHESSYQIPTYNLPSGIYFLQIQDGEGRMLTKKFVIQK